MGVVSCPLSSHGTPVTKHGQSDATGREEPPLGGAPSALPPAVMRGTRLSPPLSCGACLLAQLAWRIPRIQTASLSPNSNAFKGKSPKSQPTRQE